MSDRRMLPPLNAIKAFEVAARLGGFVEAARELAVTPSAVSQQVKQLETWLGRPLFERMPRGLQPTDAARAYLQTLSECLDRIEGATREVMRGDTRAVLSVSVLPSFAAQWLVPRLSRFYDRNPDIEVRLSATDRLVDLEREQIDVALRYGAGQYPGLEVEQVMEETITPVCSPALLQGPTPLREMADLRHHVLLHDDGHNITPLRLTWVGWLKAVGADGLGIEAMRGPVFSDSHLTIRAALAGRGVMLGRSRLVEDELREGLLVAPFAQSLPAVFSYWLVSRPGTAALHKVARFREWLREEASGKAQP